MKYPLLKLGVIVGLIGVWTILVPASASDNPEAPNWIRFARQSLLVGDDVRTARPSGPNDFVSEPRPLAFRCVRKNNYWCIKNRSKWHGVRGEDSDLHAIFDRPEFAARAFVRTLRRYYNACGLKSAKDILCKYAPDKDCIGSDAERLPDGTCVRGVNKCEDYARYIERQIGISKDADLQLFPASGASNTYRITVMAQYVARYETGRFIPARSLISQGLELEARQDLKDGTDTLRCP